MLKHTVTTTKIHDRYSSLVTYMSLYLLHLHIASTFDLTALEYKIISGMHQQKINKTV
jgi:hypothetical protein